MMTSVGESRSRLRSPRRSSACSCWDALRPFREGLTPGNADRPDAGAESGERRDVLADHAVGSVQRHRHAGIDAFQRHRLFADIEDLLASQRALDMVTTYDASEHPPLAAIDRNRDAARRVRRVSDGGEG